MSLCHKDPECFDKSVQLHKCICNNSTAIKLIQTLEDSCDAIRLELKNDETMLDIIIDLAEASKTANEGVFYIQCLHKHKGLITEWIHGLNYICHGVPQL